MNINLMNLLLDLGPSPTYLLNPMSPAFAFKASRIEQRHWFIVYPRCYQIMIDLDNLNMRDQCGLLTFFPG